MYNISTLHYTIKKTQFCKIVTPSAHKMKYLPFLLKNKTNIGKYLQLLKRQKKQGKKEYD